MDFESRGNEYLSKDWEGQREVVQETNFPTHWNLEMAKKWAKSVPEKTIEKYPETPLRKFDLKNYGYGEIFVKDESDRSINPTGTMKDRIGRKAVRDFSEQAKSNLFLAKHNNKKDSNSWLADQRLRRPTILTAGNAGMALAHAFKSFEMPPPKLLLDSHTPRRVIDNLKRENADIYLVDLGVNPFDGKPSTDSPLTKEQILLLTNNIGGTDLTSASWVEGAFWTYHNLAYSLFKKKPHEIYTPAGSHLLFESLVNNQESYLAELNNPEGKNTDTIESIRALSILAAEPENFPSIADKLHAPAKPFVVYKGPDVEFIINRGVTGPYTGVYKVSEESIKKAYEILNKEGAASGLKTEYSAAAGLALYMDKWVRGVSEKISDVIIINTGNGLVGE